MAFQNLAQGKGWFSTLNEDLNVLRGKTTYARLTGINGWTSNGCTIIQYDAETYRLINLSGQIHYSGTTVGSGYANYIATIPSGDYDHLSWQHGFAMSNGRMGGIVNDGTNKLKLYVPNFAVNNGDNWQVSITIIQTKS